MILDYGDEPGPDELIPVITLSFKSRHEETSQEHREETSPQTSPEVPGSPAMDTLFEGEPIVVDGAGNVIGGQSRVCFDVPCEPNKPYDPSEFGGVKLVDSHTNVPPVPHRGLDRMKRARALVRRRLGRLRWLVRQDRDDAGHLLPRQPPPH